MSDLICGPNEDSLNIQVSVIDKAIVDLQTVVDELSGVDGIQLIKEVGKLVEDNLDGQYKEAIVEATGDRVLSYETGIVNVMGVIYILKVYREYLKNGPNSKLNENLGHIVEPKVMYKEVDDLEQSLGITRSRINENGELDKYISRRSNYLEQEIRRKESQEPPQDASREKYLLSVLKYNDSKHLGIRPKIVEVTQELLQINQRIEEQVKVLIGEVESYDKLWDGYANQDLKVIEYNNINYSLGDIEATFKSDILTMRETMDILFSDILKIFEEVWNNIADNLEEKMTLLNVGVTILLNNLADIYGGILDSVGGFLDDILKNMGAPEWLDNFLINSDNLSLEGILKGFGPFGFADMAFIGYHVKQGFSGDITKYDMWKELAGDTGSIVGGKIGSISGKVIGAGIGGAIGGIIGGVVEPVGGEVVGAGMGEKIGLGVGGYIVGAVGSIEGETIAEGIFEAVVPEDDDNTIRWFWEA